MNRYLLTFLLSLASPLVSAQATDPLQHSIDELRSSEGQWSVDTDFLNEDGSVARSVTGTYEFSWVVKDRVLVGRNEIPELQRASGILFYINEQKQQIEMAAVGGDGMLWIMTGELGSDVRTSQEYPAANGGTGQLRFTRFNVTPDAFESRMEYTEDGGQTWKPGNHQQFTRVMDPAPARGSNLEPEDG